MKHYDYIITGGGAAGLSLAYRLIQSPLRDRRILVIDRDEKRANDRTWCFWSRRQTHFTPIYHRSWQRLRVRSDRFDRSFDLGEYRYNMLRGIDFYQFTRQELSVRPNVDFLTAQVDQVIDGPDFATVAAGGRSLQASWVFDSRFSYTDFDKKPDRYHYLLQHFRGWEIEASSDCFDSSTPDLFDFRTEQETGLRFFYVLPFTERKALVEYTVFSNEVLDDEAYESKIREHIAGRLKINDYTICSNEKGVIPMTDHSFPRRLGERIFAIGTKAGIVKPSSGYAFLRILRDSAAIVRSLERYDHPFRIPTLPARYRLFDSVLLQILFRQAHLGRPIFEQLFKNNPIDRIFRFLDETGGWFDNLKLLTSLPPLPFIRSLIKIKLLRKL